MFQAEEAAAAKASSDREHGAFQKLKETTSMVGPGTGRGSLAQKQTWRLSGKKLHMRQPHEKPVSLSMGGPLELQRQKTGGLLLFSCDSHFL